MPVLFAVTLFVSATLLFMVQPMVAKMILPLLGGSPAAWNTCMVFFQGLLLIGYLYAHRVTTHYSDDTRRQTRVHLVVLGAVLAWLAISAMTSPNGSPVAIFKTLAPQGQSYPMFGVLMLLGVAIGLPFLVISTSAPLLQRWFSLTGHPSAADPYFLYAASNAGSLLSLLGYPLVIEPSLTLADQAWLWAVGFGVLAVLIFFCGRAANNPVRPVIKAKPKPKDAPPEPPLPPLPILRKLRWLGLAFVPSSLMLGVTFHMTTDIASVPLLWVIPLALYLLTFIIAFARTPAWFRPVLENLSPVLTLLLVFVMVSGVTKKEGFTQFMALSIHIVVYFFTALLMHSELARLRPQDVRYLTQYFLWMSLGGVTGGIFNALIAPVAFTQSIEYPIAIAIGCLLIPAVGESSSQPTPAPAGAAAPPPPEPKADYARYAAYVWDLTIPLAMVGLMWWLTSIQGEEWFQQGCFWVSEQIRALFEYCGATVMVGWDTIMVLAVYALPCMLCFFFIDRPIRFGLCVSAVLAVSLYKTSRAEAVEEAARSFFGILRVERDYSPRYPFFFDPNKTDKGEQPPPQAFITIEYFHKLSHGTTLHGMQASDRNGMRQPISYMGQLDLRGRPTAREWSAEAALRDDLRLLMATDPWNAVMLGGAQAAWDARQEPLTYYHRTGPVGEMFRRLRQMNPRGDVAMVGLGTGSVACYALPGQSLTFYEIDPLVRDLVETPKYFSYVDDARKRGAEVDIIMGDARLMLEPPGDSSRREKHHDRKFSLLLVDAFSSDSIPVHLLTREAIELYKSRLAPGGLLALHISNRYIMLEPVVARLAEDAKLKARVWNDRTEAIYPGKTSSSWVVLANSEEDLGEEIRGDFADDRFGAVGGGWCYWALNHNWRSLQVLPEVEAWTDDYSDVMRVMTFDEIRRARRFFGLPVPKLSGD